MRNLRLYLLLLFTRTANPAKYPLGYNCTDPDDAIAESKKQVVAETEECGDVLICSSGKCRQCVSNKECQDLNGPEHACLTLDSNIYICAHKHLLPPDLRDYTALVLAILLCAVSSAGGIGGGGLLLPMLILLLAFTPHDASPLTNATVLGGACANLAFYSQQRHPSGRRALISFEVALMMEPMTMAGALIGVVLNKVFPGWLITILLVVVLGLTTHRTLSKGLAAWKKESAAAAMPDAASALLGSGGGAGSGAPSPLSGGEGAAAEMDEAAAAFSALPKTMAEEAAHAFSDVGTLVAALCLCTMLSALRGPGVHHDSPLHMHCGSIAYWLSMGVQLAVLLAFSFVIRRTLLQRHAKRVASRYPFLPDDVQWTPTTTVTYPLMCALAGLCAGLFGIGGGIVKGPLMLEMGMLPQVASATSAFMIFFTAASATLQYAMIGDIRSVYAACLFLAGLVGTALGQKVIGSIVRKSGRQSLIILSIAFVIGGSTLVMSITGVLGFLAEVREGKSQGFRPLCESMLVDDR